MLEIEGVQLGQGSRNDLTSATVAEVAAKCGVSERTMRYRLALAKMYEEFDPKTKAQVDSGTTTVTAECRKRKKNASSNRARKNNQPVEWPAESGRSSRSSESKQERPPASSAKIEREARAGGSNEHVDDHIIAFPSLSHARGGDVDTPASDTGSTAAAPVTSRAVADEIAVASDPTAAHSRIQQATTQVDSPAADANPYTRLLRCIVDHVRASGVTEMSDLRAMFDPLQRLLKRVCNAATTSVAESLAMLEAEIARVMEKGR